MSASRSRNATAKGNGLSAIRARGDDPISSLPRLSLAGDEIGQSIVGPGEHLRAQAIGLYVDLVRS